MAIALKRFKLNEHKLINGKSQIKKAINFKFFLKLITTFLQAAEQNIGLKCYETGVEPNSTK